MNADNNYGLVKLIHPNGASVTIPLPVDGSIIGNEVAHALLASVTNLVDAGFMVSEADRVGADEMEVNFVVHGQVNNEGRITERIWFYAPWGDANNGAQLTHYLNVPEDLAAFEAASELRVADLPLVDGRASPAANTGVFRQNARAVTMKVLRRKEEDKGSPVGYKWALVKYLGSAPQGSPAPSAPTNTQRAQPTQQPPSAPQQPPSDLKPGVDPVWEGVKHLFNGNHAHYLETVRQLTESDELTDSQEDGRQIEVISENRQQRLFEKSGQRDIEAIYTQVASLFAGRALFDALMTMLVESKQITADTADVDVVSKIKFLRVQQTPVKANGKGGR